MNGVEMNEVCGECHRMPPAKGVATNWQNAWNVRHQPVYLAESKCFVGGGVTCMNCHKPHSDERVDVVAQCKGCHAAPRHEQAVSTGCLDCHMPKVSPGPHLTFTNHWIGIYAEGDPLRPRP
jgi:formate-dependent nitrite reductase cytochrome c552 subunit